MLPFRKYNFTYPGTMADPSQSIRSAIAKQGRIIDKSKDEYVKLFHKLPVLFQNSFNPVFCGTLNNDPSDRAELLGYFRPNWLVVAFVVIFIAFPIYEVWSISHLPDEMPGYLPDWKDRQLEFEYQFLAATIVLVGIGWSIGIPYMRRILNALEESTHADA